MRVDRMASFLTALHVARNAFGAPQPPPSRLVPGPKDHPDVQVQRVVSGNVARGNAVGLTGFPATTGSGVARPASSAGRLRRAPARLPLQAARPGFKAGKARARIQPPSSHRASGLPARNARGSGDPPHAARRSAPMRSPQPNRSSGEHFAPWLGRIHAAAQPSTLPAPQCRASAGSAPVTPSSDPPNAHPAVRKLLIDTRIRRTGGQASREEAAREVDFARAQLAWICGPETDAEQRQLAWSAVPENTRLILRHMQQLFSDWSPGAVATDEQRNASISAIVGGRGMPSLTVDQICRFEWIRSVQALALRSKLTLQTPLDFLLAVHQLLGMPASSVVDTEMRLHENLDVERVEAARLLYERSRNPYFTPDYSAGLKAAQQDFRDALAEDLALWHSASEVIPMAAPSHVYTPLWFDGMSIGGAIGKNISQLAQDMQLRGVPLKRANLLLERRFRDLRESTDYLVGTPHQSMATILLRLGPQAGIATDGLDDVACLLQRFHLLEDHLMASGIYPLSPTLLAARHCARSCGVLASSTLDAEQLLAQETRHLITELSERKGQLFDPEAVASFDWHHLIAMAKGDHPLTNTPIEQAAIALLKKLWLTREIIVEPTETAVNEALLAWFGKRLLAYAALPVFDEAQYAYDLLVSRFGLSKAQIETPRGYYYSSLVASSRPPVVLPVVRIGSRVQEFLDRQRYAVSDDRKLTSDGMTIDTRYELEEGRRIFDLGLVDTEVVRLKATEILRLKQQPLTPQNVGRVAGGIARNAQVKTVARPVNDLAVLLARGMQIMSVMRPLEDIIEVFASGDPRRIVDVLPFLGAAYQIEQGMWHRNWKQAGMGVLRLGADALFAWVAGLAEEEIARSLMASLSEAGHVPFEPPSVSMLRDFQQDFLDRTDGALPGEVLDPADVGPAQTHELRYEDAGAGAPDEGRQSPAVPEQFGDRPSRPGGSDRRTVEDCKALFEDMRLSAREASQWGGPNCGWRDCVPFVAPRRTAAQIDDLFTSSVPRLINLRDSVGETFGPAPLFQRLIAHARATEDMPTWLLVDGGKFAPITMMKDGVIFLPEEAVITSQSFVGLDGHMPFDQLGAALHEVVHALTLRRDNAGPQIWAERGVIIPLTEQIYYERNMALDQRIVYERYIPPEESSRVYARARAARPGARLDGLIENVELDALFAKLNQAWPDYTILGTPAEKRVTVAQSPNLVAHVLDTVCNRPHDYRAGARFRALVVVDGPTGFDQAGVQNELFQAFDNLRAQNDLISAIAENALAKQNGKSWRFIFDAPDLASEPPQAWRVDRAAGTVSFNHRPLYYLSRGGPQVLTLERKLLGALIELEYGHALPSLSFDMGMNRGPAVWLENVLLDETGTFAQRVSAELSDEPRLLWSKVGYASKAASDEDIRLEFLNAHLKPASIQHMENMGEYWI